MRGSGRIRYPTPTIVGVETGRLIGQMSHVVEDLTRDAD
jgi:hypothetical protein